MDKIILDLGVQPLANRYLRPEQLDEAEPFYPLRIRVCSSCWLVQLPVVQTPDSIFGDYAYFSSYSDSWLEHSRRYVEQMVSRFGLGPGHQVIEVASNDGYLLQFFRDRGIPVLGVEPAVNVAREAQRRGIATRVEFFGANAADAMRREGQTADLLIGNNVLAHVPDLNDFVEGLRRVLRPAGVLTTEFPHLMRLLASNQFDTMYHEHFSYFSFLAAEEVFRRHGLRIFDVEELPTHGGSLRVYAALVEDSTRVASERVSELRERERAAGFCDGMVYEAFAERVAGVKCALLDFLIHARESGQHVVGYGAPAKGNTLLNYCGVHSELLAYTVDRSPHKQGRFLPGSRIPIFQPDHILATRPDYVLILPWNIRDEIMEHMACIRTWGGRFVVPIPHVEVLA